MERYENNGIGNNSQNNEFNKYNNWFENCISPIQANNSSQNIEYAERLIHKNKKILRNLSLIYIIFFFLSLILSIAAYAVSVSAVFEAADNKSLSEIERLVTTALVLEIIAIIISLTTFSIAIVLAIKMNNIRMRVQQRNLETIYILSIIGIFVPFISLIVSFMIILKFKKIR